MKRGVAHYRKAYEACAEAGRVFVCLAGENC